MLMLSPQGSDLGLEVILSLWHRRVLQCQLMEPAHVLVVDDEKHILTVFREALTQFGYRVTCAASGTEALAAVRGELFDAAFLSALCTARRERETEEAALYRVPLMSRHAQAPRAFRVSLDTRKCLSRARRPSRLSSRSPRPCAA